MTFATYIPLLAAAATAVNGHGFVQGLRANGAFSLGYNPSFQFQNPPPVVAGWSDPADLSNGFIAPDAAGSPDVICHLGATNAKTSISIPAGGKLDFLWTVWPASHKGPVITYLAKCPGSCETVDKTTLEFFKIDQVGLISSTQAQNGYWAADAMIANNNTWTTIIPPTLAPGNYVARHEVIALHSAGNADGAQLYPQCVNVQVTGGGSDAPAGVLGTSLYTQTSPGMIFNIYNNPTSYPLPGPDIPAAFSSVSGTGMSAGGASGGVSGSSSSSSAATPSSSATVLPSSVLPSYGNSTAPATTPTTSAAASPTVAPVNTPAPSSTTSPLSACTSQSTITVHATGTTTAVVDSVTTAAPTTVVTSIRPASPTTSAAGGSAGTGTGNNGGGSSGGTGTGTTSNRIPLPDGANLKDVIGWLDQVLEAYYSQPVSKRGPEAASLRRSLDVLRKL